MFRFLVVVSPLRVPLAMMPLLLDRNHVCSPASQAVLFPLLFYFPFLFFALVCLTLFAEQHGTGFWAISHHQPSARILVPLAVFSTLIGVPPPVCCFCENCLDHGAGLRWRHDRHHFSPGGELRPAAAERAGGAVWWRVGEFHRRRAFQGVPSGI